MSRLRGVLCDAPGDEADADPRDVASRVQLPPKPCLIFPVPAAKDTETTGVGEGFGQSPACHDVHGRQHDRLAYSKE